MMISNIFEQELRQQIRLSATLNDMKPAKFQRENLRKNHDNGYWRKKNVVEDKVSILVQTPNTPDVNVVIASNLCLICVVSSIKY